MTAEHRIDEDRPAARDTGPPDASDATADRSDAVAAAGPGRRRGGRPVRTPLIVLVAITVVVAAGLVATGAVGGDGGDSTATVPSDPAETVRVEKTTLTRTETVDGTLGYGTPSAVSAGGEPAESPGDGSTGSTTGGSRSGILTWLPGAGDVIERGETVYRVDEDKVPLLYGPIPLYRTLDVGAEGADVELLETNLTALGYTGFTADDEYTSGTAVAVGAWQVDLGREETGKVETGDAVVASGAKRVAEVTAERGGAATGEILGWTATERIVTVDLGAEYEDLVEDGIEAVVTLPDGTEADATVTDVGNAATAPPAGETGGEADAQEATLPVELSVKEQRKLGRYQAAPVDVTLTAETRKDVLAVPVNALVARNGGGYAVQAVTAGGVEYRPVELGMFADGLVEIAGDGVTAGLKVGVPR